MKKMNTLSKVLVCVVLAAATGVHADTPAEKSTAEPVIPADDLVYCTVCHGVQLMGNPIIHAPRISGLESWYVDKQLHAFKDGLRGTDENDEYSMEMRTMAAALSDAQIAQAVKFVTQTKSAKPERTLAGDATAGAALFTSCAVCHGAAAEGNESLGSPALAGLNDWYLQAQLQNFKTGKRGSHPGDMSGMQMRAAAQILPDDKAVTDVVAYIVSLSSPD